MGGKNSGNPNIRDAYMKSTGPTTEMGKFRASLNSSKELTKYTNINQMGDSLVCKMMKEAGVDFSIPKKALELRNLFVIWARYYNGKELSEIQQIDQLIQIIDTDMSQRVMEKLNMGIALDDGDLKLMRLLKETLESSHRMKFGEKKVNINVGYNDIRKMMFPDDNPRGK